MWSFSSYLLCGPLPLEPLCLILDQYFSNFKLRWKEESCIFIGLSSEELYLRRDAQFLERRFTANGKMRAQGRRCGIYEMPSCLLVHDLHLYQPLHHSFTQYLYKRFDHSYVRELKLEWDRQETMIASAKSISNITYDGHIIAFGAAWILVFSPRGQFLRRIKDGNTHKSDIAICGDLVFSLSKTGQDLNIYDWKRGVPFPSRPLHHKVIQSPLDNYFMRASLDTVVFITRESRILYEFSMAGELLWKEWLPFVESIQGVSDITENKSLFIAAGNVVVYEYHLRS
jgi:hypothetical protein